MRVVIFGATSAIAQSVARLFAAEGAELFLVARNAERVEAVRADLIVRGAKAVVTMVADLAEIDAHEAIMTRAGDALGAIDAALIAYGTLSDQSRCESEPSLMRRELTTNFLSQASLLMRLAMMMERQQAGTIAVIGSVAGDRGRASNYVYGSAKAGLRVLAQGLRHRLGRSGVRVVLIEPGFVDTPMTAGLAKGGALWATPDRVAHDIRHAMNRNAAIAYTPWFWRWIMLIVRFMPDALFQRVRL
jgi:decaprenylphospho-beta-D-erythro-pentofuranosid-2-ulose 2-reductase